MLETGYLTDVVENNEVIRNCFKCRQRVKAAIDCQRNQKDGSGDLPVEQFTPRDGMLGSIFVVDENGRCVTLKKSTHLSELSWVEVQAMHNHHPGEGFAVASLLGELYVVGGTGTRAANSVQVYNPVRNQWRAARSMITNRTSHGCCGLNGHIYVCGGVLHPHVLPRPLSSCEVYNPQLNDWNALPDMEKERCSLAVVAFQERVWALGGLLRIDGLAVVPASDTVEIYDPVRGRWTAAKPMLTGRMGHMAAAVSDKLYVFGGWAKSTEHLRSCEVYDSAADQFTYIGDMWLHRPYCGIAVRGKSIFVMKWHPNDESSRSKKSVYVYDTQTDTWKHGPNMFSFRLKFLAAVTVIMQ